MSARRGEARLLPVSNFQPPLWAFGGYRLSDAKEEDRYFGSWLDGILGPYRFVLDKDGGMQCFILLMEEIRNNHRLDAQQPVNSCVKLLIDGI